MINLSIQDLANLRSAIDIAIADPNAWTIKNDLQRLHGQLLQFTGEAVLTAKVPSPAPEVAPEIESTFRK